MLQMRLGLADVTTLSQTTAPDGLLMGAFHARTGRVLLTKRLGGLLLTPPL
jgi:hypothetical protein